MHLVFEFLEQDLGKLIRKKNGMPESEYKKIFYEIVRGLKFMHDRHIYHRDLKPQNILVGSSGEIKIGDFGLSRVIVNPNRTFSKEIETLWYRSPELLLGRLLDNEGIKHYDGGVDTWSLGCILYELAEGKVLFRGDSEISQISA